MKNGLVCEKYLSILRIEMEHLSRHIENMVREHLEREKAGSETEHVCLENIAVLKGEECGFHSMAKILEKVDAEAYEDVDALDRALRIKFREHIRCCGLPQAAVVFAERKMDKVLDYCRPTGVTTQLVKEMAQQVKKD